MTLHIECLKWVHSTIATPAAAPEQIASLWLSEELVDGRHDFWGLVMHKASEAVHCVTPPLLMILKHTSCPPCLVYPVN